MVPLWRRVVLGFVGCLEVMLRLGPSLDWALCEALGSLSPGAREVERQMFDNWLYAKDSEVQEDLIAAEMELALAVQDIAEDELSLGVVSWYLVALG